MTLQVYCQFQNSSFSYLIYVGIAIFLATTVLILYCNYIMIVFDKTFLDDLFKNPQLNNLYIQLYISLFYIINFNIYTNKYFY